jgi:hypothetical protein
MRPTPLALALAFALAPFAFVACEDKPPPGPAATTTTATTATASAAASSAKPKIEMPPRPIPKPRNTVGTGDPEEAQLEAIGYMQAMVQPHPDDPILDDVWVKGLVPQLETVNRGFDKGPAAQKAKLNKVELVGGGRQINLLMASGCDDQIPTRAAQAVSAPLATMHDHGVLVVRCNDARVQCLQSTRDLDDVLCTTAPRH